MLMRMFDCPKGGLGRLGGATCAPSEHLIKK